jgi:hypothetical protein
MRRRERRRHDRWRVIERTKRLIRTVWTHRGMPPRLGDPNEAAKLADNLAHCDNICCANPRHTFGELPMQERRQRLREEDVDE